MAVVDIFLRNSYPLAARFIYLGEEIVETPERVCGRIGYLQTVRVNNFNEFISRGIDL